MNWQTRRQNLVSGLEQRGIRDKRVLTALTAVPREQFVPAAWQDHAYADRALPIGREQTISQPYVVALMTELLQLVESDRVLELGTGSGYQTAVLAELAAAVYTVECLPSLADQAQRRLQNLGYRNISFRIGDGHRGWPQQAPFDAMIVTAACAAVPPALKEQLKLGGRLVLPVGPLTGQQKLVRMTRTKDGWSEDAFGAVSFVPFRHEDD